VVTVAPVRAQRDRPPAGDPLALTVSPAAPGLSVGGRGKERRQTTHAASRLTGRIERALYHIRRSDNAWSWHGVCNRGAIAIVANLQRFDGFYGLVRGYGRGYVLECAE
jgi:hypothetical protein